MLLELTESDLINDFGVKDRAQRERILNAIEAINTSTFSDEEDEDDDDEEEDANEDDEEELEESEEHNADSSIPHTRHSIGGGRINGLSICTLTSKARFSQLNPYADSNLWPP